MTFAPNPGSRASLAQVIANDIPRTYASEIAFVFGNVADLLRVPRKGKKITPGDAYIEAISVHAGTLPKSMAAFHKQIHQAVNDAFASQTADEVADVFLEAARAIEEAYEYVYRSPLP